MASPRVRIEVAEQKTWGGDSVLVLSCFSFFRVEKLVEMFGEQDSAKYCALLNDELLPNKAVTMGERWIFQQSNASIHRSAHTRFCFTKHIVDVLAGPLRSADLNTIEHLWGDPRA